MGIAELLHEISTVPIEKRAITNLNVLNEAYDYGSAFSRGMRIDRSTIAMLHCLCILIDRSLIDGDRLERNRMPLSRT